MQLRTDKFYTQEEIDNILASVENNTFMKFIRNDGVELSYYKGVNGDIVDTSPQGNITQEYIDKLNTIEEYAKNNIVKFSGQFPVDGDIHKLYIKEDETPKLLYEYDGTNYNQISLGTSTSTSSVENIKYISGATNSFVAVHNDFFIIENDSLTNSVDFSGLAHGESIRIAFNNSSSFGYVAVKLNLIKGVAQVNSDTTTSSIDNLRTGNTITCTCVGTSGANKLINVH